MSRRCWNDSTLCPITMALIACVLLFFRSAQLHMSKHACFRSLRRTTVSLSLLLGERERKKEKSKKSKNRKKNRERERTLPRLVRRMLSTQPFSSQTTTQGEGPAGCRPKKRKPTCTQSRPCQASPNDDEEYLRKLARRKERSRNTIIQPIRTTTTTSSSSSYSSSSSSSSSFHKIYPVKPTPSP